ncbi:MAG: hypothetical protein ACMUJM_22730 [bacterium]
MLQVTENAKSKLKEILEKESKFNNDTLRIVYSGSKSNSLQLIFDQERKDDRIIVTGKDGKKILVIDPKLAKDTSGMIVDYQLTKEGYGFTIHPMT